MESESWRTCRASREQFEIVIIAGKSGSAVFEVLGVILGAEQFIGAASSPARSTIHSSSLSRRPFVLVNRVISAMRLRSSAPARGAHARRVGAGYEAGARPDFSMRNTVSRSLRSMRSKRSPLIPTRWGMSITASGSVQRTSSQLPGSRDFRALRVLSAGRGHFSPERSNLIVVMARHVWIVGGQSTAAPFRPEGRL